MGSGLIPTARFARSRRRDDGQGKYLLAATHGGMRVVPTNINWKALAEGPAGRVLAVRQGSNT
jgi:hypothetical protein